MVVRTDGRPAVAAGGNIIRRDLGPAMIAKVSKLLHDSIAYAVASNGSGGRAAARRSTARAQTRSSAYVNDLTLSMTAAARALSG
jgi:predicted solute-binding protein